MTKQVQSVMEFPDAGLSVKDVSEQQAPAVFNADAKNPTLVTVTEWKGTVSLDVRQVWHPGGEPEGVFTRTKMGARIPVAELDDFIEYLMAIRDEAKALQEAVRK